METLVYTENYMTELCRPRTETPLFFKKRLGFIPKWEDKVEIKGQSWFIPKLEDKVEVETRVFTPKY